MQKIKKKKEKKIEDISLTFVNFFWNSWILH